MKLSTKSRYGLRLLFRLATAGKEVVPLSEIAEKEDISEKYLEHIINRLKVAGIVQAQRGIKGGYILSRSPDTISLLEVIEVLEGPLVLVDCVGKRACERMAVCPTQWVWDRLSSVLRQELAHLTLDDMIRRYTEISVHNYEI
ncbi:MAG: Rrf2 family transcriptional regulator [Brevinematales bacterium]|nr:Rrf2 family transcriptional regulator [Brevinematales bacterium]